jgi:hypothetical protein
MSCYFRKVKTSSRPPDTPIVEPQIRLTLSPEITSACAPGTAIPYPASKTPSRMNKIPSGFRRSSVSIRYRFRMYHVPTTATI